MTLLFKQIFLRSMLRLKLLELGSKEKVSLLLPKL
jgi:hypothetical protein